MPRVTKQTLLKPPSLSFFMATINTKRLLHFDPNSALVTKVDLSGKGIVKCFPNRPFFIFTDTSTKPQCFGKRRILGDLNVDISTIVSTKVLQKSSQDE